MNKLRNSDFVFYRNMNIPYIEAKVLQELEQKATYTETIQLDKKHIEFLDDLKSKIGNIPKLDEITEDSIGFKIENNEIIGLGLPNCELKELPTSIENLKSLKLLNLSNNKLMKFPKLICRLSSIQILNLSSNRLKEIPNEISNLKHLEKLNLSFNELKELPDSIGELLLLQSINLDNNHLNNLPESIINLVGIKDFSLSDNELPADLADKFMDMALKATGKRFGFLWKIAEACKKGIEKEPFIARLKTIFPPLLYAASIACIGVPLYLIISSVWPTLLVEYFLLFLISAMIINFIIGISIISTLSGYFKNFIEKTGSNVLAKNLRGGIYRNFDVFVIIYLIWSVRLVIKLILEVEVVPSIDFIFEFTIPNWLLNLLVFLGYNLNLTFLENLDLFLGYFWLKLFSTALIFWALFRNGFAIIGSTAFGKKKEKKLYLLLVFGLFGSFSLAIIRYSTFWIFLNIGYSIGIIIGGALFIIFKKYREIKFKGFLLLVYVFFVILIIRMIYLVNIFLALSLSIFFIIMFFIFKYRIDKSKKFQKTLDDITITQISQSFEKVKFLKGMKEDKERGIKNLDNYNTISKKSFKPVNEIKWTSKSVFRVQNNRIVEISINNGGLEELPDQIFQLTKLKSLYLNQNKIKILPDSMGTLRELEILFLSNNNLEHLPSTIGNLVNLKWLFLMNNPLHTIPEKIGALKSLISLDLGLIDNIALPESLLNVKSLKELNLQGTTIYSSSDSILNSLTQKGVKIYR